MRLASAANVNPWASTWCGCLSACLASMPKVRKRSLPRKPPTGLGPRMFSDASVPTSLRRSSYTSTSVPASLRRKEVGTEASENILGPNPVVGLRGKDLFRTFGMLARQALRQPHQVLAHGFTFAAEASRILGGSSELAPDLKDRRFQDPTWKENRLYRSGLQL